MAGCAHQAIQWEAALNRFRVRTLVLLPALAATSLLAVGCGATTEKPNAGGQSCTPGAPAELPDPKPLTVNEPLAPAAAAKLPDAVRAKGKLTIAADASYAPNEFTADGSNQIIGMDVDLGNAIGRALGVQVEFVNASFDGILAGIQAGRYDAGMSSFTDTKEREQTVDFVTYFKAGTSTMVRKCNPKGVKTDLDLCGKNIGAENGTTQLDEITKEDTDGSLVKKCKDAGKAPPNGQGFPKQTDVNAALQADRIDAYLADSPVVDYALKKTGDAFEKVGEAQGVAPYGIAIAKTSGPLKDAVQAAVQQLMTDGTYQKILDNWGVKDGAINQSTINGAQ
jgi:polar amino acid transport system substrate-binding protein